MRLRYLGLKLEIFSEDEVEGWMEARAVSEFQENHPTEDLSNF